MTDFDSRWDDLLRTVLSGGAVPFLGSGVSLNARDPKEPAFRPTVAWMIEQLLPLAEGFRPVAPDNGREVWQDLGALADVAKWEKGPVKVLDAVKLPSFARMDTQPAHRYLARLAREGWIRELITVNYDDCFERAYRDTFRLLRQGDAADHRWPAVIRTEEEYRIRGAPHGVDEHPASPEPAPILYKINGCAAEWVGETDEGKRKKLAERILLADPQLGSPDLWKLDLLRDRLRSRALVFSGFGSAEAQIRYNVLGIGASGNGKDSHGPVGPFVHAYGCQPTYVQLQLLAPGKDGLPDAQRLFTGEDAPKLGAKVEELRADLLWMRVYQAAMCQTMCDALGREGSPVRRWIQAATGVGRTGGPLGAELLAWLRGKKHIAEHRRFGAQAHLWEEWQPDGPDRTLVLQAILAAARRVERRVESYRPLHQDELEIWCLLVALWVTGADLQDARARSRACRHGVLRVKTPARQLLLLAGGTLPAGRKTLSNLDGALPTRALDLGETDRPDRVTLRFEGALPGGPRTLRVRTVPRERLSEIAEIAKFRVGMWPAPPPKTTPFPRLRLPKMTRRVP